MELWPEKMNEHASMPQILDSPTQCGSKLLHLCLHEGMPVLLRPVKPEDRERIQAGMAALSPESRYFRFFTCATRLSDRQLRYFTEVDQRDHIAWVVLDSTDPIHPGLGAARFIRIKEEPTIAEMALTVVDAWQRRALGTLLLALLLLEAKANGIQILRAAVLIENGTMFKWLNRLGAVGSYEHGEQRLNLTVDRTLAHLSRTPSGERIKHAIEAVQTVLHEHHTYEKQA